MTKCLVDIIKALLELCMYVLILSISIDTVIDNLNLFCIDTVPVTSVTLLPEVPITVIAEQQMNLNCTTSACNPSANIQWFMTSKNITSHSSSEITPDGMLNRTVSLLNLTVKKQDNKKQVFCRTSNIPGYNVTSSKQTIHVLCK